MCNFDFHTTKYRKARKQYTCSACSIPIYKDTKYSLSVQVSEGTVDSFKLHLECESRFQEFLREQGEGCGDLQSIWEYPYPIEVKEKYEFGPWIENKEKVR